MTYCIVEERRIFKVQRHRLPCRKFPVTLVKCKSFDAAMRFKEGFEWAERRARHYAKAARIEKGSS